MMRELRNYTQEYMSSLLGMSPSGYSKIERDETDISLRRLQQIAEILQTDLSIIINFDARNVFNMRGNNFTNLHDTNQNQQIMNEDAIKNWMQVVSTDINDMKKEIREIKRKNA